MKTIFLFSFAALITIAALFTAFLMIGAYVVIRRMTRRPIESTVHDALEKTWEKTHPEGAFDIELDDGKKVHGMKDAEGHFEYVDKDTGKWVVLPD